MNSLFEEDTAIGQSGEVHLVRSTASGRTRAHVIANRIGLMSRNSSSISVFRCFLGLGSVSEHFRNSVQVYAPLRDLEITFTPLCLRLSLRDDWRVQVQCHLSTVRPS